MRFTLTRQESRRAKTTLAIAGALTVLATGGLLAAPGGSEGWRIPMASVTTRDGYAIRLALPAARRTRADTPAQGARGVPPAELDETPAGKSEGLAAVAEAPEKLPVPTAPRLASRAKALGVIPLNYSLAGGADAGDAIEVEKPVTIGGSDAGRIALRIDGNARVYALGSRLAAIIAAQSGADAVPSGLAADFVSLEHLRALGLGVRYDAIRDRLVIDPPA